MRTVIGVYDHPPDEDVPFVQSVKVGDGFLARRAKDLTSAVDDVNDWLDHINPLP